MSLQIAARIAVARAHAARRFLRSLLSMGPGSPLMPMMGPTGAQSPPTPNPGVMADSLSKVGTAVQILTQALPGLPIGDELQKTVIDAISKLSKIAPASAQVPGVQATQLKGLEREAQSAAMLQALTRALGASSSAPPSSPAPAGPGAGGGMIM